MCIQVRASRPTVETDSRPQQERIHAHRSGTHKHTLTHKHRIKTGDTQKTDTEKDMCIVINMETDTACACAQIYGRDNYTTGHPLHMHLY